MGTPDPINYSPDTHLFRDGPWFSTVLTCAKCGHTWPGMAHYSATGAECVKCGDANASFNWLEAMMTFERKCLERQNDDGS